LTILLIVEMIFVIKITISTKENQMLKIAKIAAVTLAAFVMVGCSTTNSIPYKASTSNVITIQNTLKASNTKVTLGTFSMGSGVTEELLCRLMGPVKVAPGKTLSAYIKEAFQEELFLAQAYDTNASVKIEGQIEKLAFSSVSPANWEISMRVSSNKSPGYTVAVKYNYDTSFDAISACRNVADAFAPAVQELLRQVVSNPQFTQLVK
jgi:hypothetical protein